MGSLTIRRRRNLKQALPYASTCFQVRCTRRVGLQRGFVELASARHRLRSIAFAFFLQVTMLQKALGFQGGSTGQRNLAQLLCILRAGFLGRGEEHRFRLFGAGPGHAVLRQTSLSRPVCQFLLRLHLHFDITGRQRKVHGALVNRAGLPRGAEILRVQGRPRVLAIWQRGRGRRRDLRLAARDGLRVAAAAASATPHVNLQTTVLCTHGFFSYAAMQYRRRELGGRDRVRLRCRRRSPAGSHFVEQFAGGGLDLRGLGRLQFPLEGLYHIEVPVFL